MKINYFDRKLLAFNALCYLLKSCIDFKLKDFETFINFKPKREKTISYSKASLFCLYVEKLSNFLKINSCIIKSVTKKNFLIKNNFVARLYIAVNYNDEFTSHSWIETDNFNNFENPAYDMKIIKVIS